MSIFKKFFLSLSLLVLVFLFVPLVVFASEDETETSELTESASISSYELFWPIVAGKVRGESFYFLKSLKEGLREAVIFSSFKKTDYNITLSEKRTVEAEKLLMEKKDYANAKKTLGEAQAKREKALQNFEKTKQGGQSTIDLSNRFISSLEKQRALLNYISAQVSEDQKSLISGNIDKLNSVLAKLQ